MYLQGFPKETFQNIRQTTTSKQSEAMAGAWCELYSKGPKAGAIAGASVGKPPWTCKQGSGQHSAVCTQLHADQCKHMP